jgi:hypothetical protein
LKKLKRFFSTTKDWLWFICVLRCNEFHPSLDVNLTKIFKIKSKDKRDLRLNQASLAIVKRRNKAHDLTEQFETLKQRFSRAMGQ